MDAAERPSSSALKRLHAALEEGMSDTSPRRRTDRQHRLAEALRANLKRRKAQQKEWRRQDAGPAANAVADDQSRAEVVADDDASVQEPC